MTCLPVTESLIVVLRHVLKYWVEVGLAENGLYSTVWIGLKWLRMGTRYYFSVSSVEHSEPITRDLGYYEEYLKVKGYACLCVVIGVVFVQSHSHLIQLGVLILCSYLSYSGTLKFSRHLNLLLRCLII
jgi:hypothetical protein